MEPLAIILGSAKVIKTIRDLAADETKNLSKEAASAGVKGFIRKLKRSDREKAIKIAIDSFAKAWWLELEETIAFSSALPGYHDQLSALLTAAAPEISDWLDPDIANVDLGPIQRIWLGVKDQATELPESFDWAQVALKYSRAIRNQFRDDPTLRGAYDTVLNERTLAAVERTASAVESIAGSSKSIDILAYKQFLLEKKCNTLQLATLDSSGYTVDRRVSLWSVFIPQSARSSAPILGIPPEILRELREEGEIEQANDETDAEDVLRKYRSAPIRPVLDMIEPDSNGSRLLVVTGDPGAGKTALLKYLCLRWVKESHGPIPILIDLKEYGKKQEGLIKFCQSGLTMPRFTQSQLESLLSSGSAALYLDGLDEIFVPAARRSVVEEVASLSSEFPKAQILVTSRKVGYQPERLGGAGFAHATLEDFSSSQIHEFLSKWHLVADDEEVKRDRLQQRLYKAISESRSLRELAGNPLLLTMMAIINRGQELPRNRVSLYQKASEVLLHDWDDERALATDDPIDREDKQRLLLDLAGEMQQVVGGFAGNIIEKAKLVARFKRSLDQLEVKDSRATALALVKQLEERSFVLASAGGNRFAFVHRTFLEFFCAAWFVDRLGHKEGSELYLSLEQLQQEVFAKHWRDEKWREVLRLIVGMVHETKANELILFLTRQEGSEIYFGNLVLAASCLSDVRNRKVLLETDQMLWSKITSAFVQLASESAEKKSAEVPSAIYEEAVRWIATTWRVQAQAWLKDLVESGPAPIRSSAVQEFARSWKQDTDTLLWLKLQAYENSDGDACEKAVGEIANGWSDEAGTFKWTEEVALKAMSAQARRGAVQALAMRFREEAGVREFVRDRALGDPSGLVRAHAWLFLGVRWNRDEEIRELMQQRFSHDDDWIARFMILVALTAGWRDEPGTRAILESALSDSETDVRRFAATTLSNIYPNDVQITKLIASAELDEDSPEEEEEEKEEKL